MSLFIPRNLTGLYFVSIKRNQLHGNFFHKKLPADPSDCTILEQTVYQFIRSVMIAFGPALSIINDTLHFCRYKIYALHMHNEPFISKAIGSPSRDQSRVDSFSRVSFIFTRVFRNLSSRSLSRETARVILTHALLLSPSLSRDNIFSTMISC